MQVSSSDTAVAALVSPPQLDSLRGALDGVVERLDSIAHTAGQLVEATRAPSWWEVGASLAAIAVAVLAVIELGRIIRDAKESKDRAAARVSAIAIPVRRQLKSWIDEMPTTVDQMEQREAQALPWNQADPGAARDAWQYWTNRSVAGHIRAAEGRIETLNEEAAFAVEATRKIVIRATADFYDAFDDLNLVMAMPWHGGLTAFPPSLEHRRRLSDAHKRLRSCMVHLEGLIDPEFEAVAGE